MTVDHAVVNGSRRVVIGIAEADDVGIQISEVATRDLEQGCGGGHETLLGGGGSGPNGPKSNVRDREGCVMTRSDPLLAGLNGGPRAWHDQI